MSPAPVALSDPHQFHLAVSTMPLRSADFDVCMLRSSAEKRLQRVNKLQQSVKQSIKEPLTSERNDTKARHQNNFLHR